MAGEQQHYVPKLLLRNFSSGKKHKIWVYDKSNGNRFHTNIKNVAAENGFYNIEVGEELLSFEPGLGQLESKASKVIKDIVRSKSIKSLDEHAVAILAMFLAVQFVRTKEHRLRYEHLGESVKRKFKKMGASEADIEEITKSGSDLPVDKLVGFKAIVGANKFVPYFINKIWVLFETSNKNPFYISDNPVTMHNELDHGPYGNIGLAVRGVEIYLPISTTLCLGILCPSLVEEYQKLHKNIEMLNQVAPGMLDKVVANHKVVSAFYEGCVNGTPIKVIEDNVTMLNSLQVIFSSRFVYCAYDSFKLVEKMINDNEKYKVGLKPVVS